MQQQLVRTSPSRCASLLAAPPLIDTRCAILLTHRVGDLQVRPYSAHRIEPPSTSVTTNKEELMKFFETMYKYRRMEIAADMMYKAKFIRGFCHL